MTAHDVVAAVRRIAGVKQVGHGGTLDPAATGVLPVALGAACRLLRFLEGNKVYLAEILLGTTTTTDDLAGEVIAESQGIPGDREITAALSRFTGEIEQVPPLYSAVHHQGDRLYDLARRGVAPEKIPARTVTIGKIEVVKIAPPVVLVRIECSTGTYIRSIARDLGAALSCGGCLRSLLRERSGPFLISQSVTLEQLQDLKAEGCLERACVDPLAALDLPVLSVGQEERRRISMGQTLALPEKNAPGAVVSVTAGEGLGLVLAVHEGELLAVCRKTADNKLKPEVVVAHAY